ncbi:MAG: restriction endonuclease subunit S, partial [Bacteroidales bacterium]|nr:restriction endonuclease subunit S [Bacteroidales bacterium]
MRFPEFSGEWELKPVEQIAPLQRGFDLPKQNINPGCIPIVYSNGILGTHSEGKCTGPGVVTGRSGTIGKLTYIESGPYWPHNTSLWVTNFYGNHEKFVYYLYQHIGIEQYASGSGVPTLNRNDVHRHIAAVPCIEEQRKIASMLSLIDERITAQSKIIEELTNLRSALLEKVFQVSSPTIEVGSIAHQISERNKLCRYSNVLSVSNRFGFINQSEQFEDRNVASDDVRNYKVVHRGDFAYNPARINVGSIAMLKRFDSGIVSPMYICFQLNKSMMSRSFSRTLFTV